jgi:phosphoserine phosphatase RsbU/P
VLVAYTDGLIERRARSLDDGLALLCRATHARHPEQVCIEVMNALVGREPPQDDIAMLALRRHAPEQTTGRIP